MEWLDIISNKESLIYDISIENSILIVYVKLWNEEKKQVKFIDYYMFKDKKSIGEEIGDILVEKDSVMLKELKCDILNGGGTLDEIVNVKSVTFYNSWNDRIILEVLADKIECD